MSIKIDLTAKGVDRQMEVLKHFPDLAEKHYRPVVTRDVKALESRIQSNIPVFSGRASDTFGSKVTGKGFRMTGKVGWYDADDPWYINVVEYGAKEHTIDRNKVTMAKFQSGAPIGGRLKIPSSAWGGDFAFPQSVQHPGMSARGFMMKGYIAFWPLITEDLAQANERIIADLAAI